MLSNFIIANGFLAGFHVLRFLLFVEKNNKSLETKVFVVKKRGRDSSWDAWRVFTRVFCWTCGPRRFQRPAGRSFIAFCIFSWRFAIFNSLLMIFVWFIFFPSVDLKKTQQFSFYPRTISLFRKIKVKNYQKNSEAFR